MNRNFDKALTLTFFYQIIKNVIFISINEYQYKVLEIGHGITLNTVNNAKVTCSEKKINIWTINLF